MEEKDDKIDANGDKNLDLNVTNTNARLLFPKINSLINCFDEMLVTVGVVTETWLSDGHGLDLSLIHI